MNGTDELRKEANKADWVHCTTLRDIADRIDAEHERLMEERADRYAELRASLKERYVELPKDADGEHIHVGDALDGYGKTIEVVEMRHGRSGWVLISRDGNGYADTFAFTHHAPTVEDVLREMLDAWGELPSNATNEAIIAEYADKLKLADGEDE